ncbi:MAG: hypothetical protein ChlgKO_06570 [Chlamydiales bacterium]
MFRDFATFIGLGLFALGPPSYSSEVLDELLALLPAQEQKSDQILFHPKLQADSEHADEKTLTYNIETDYLEEHFKIPEEELALLKTAPKHKLKRAPTNLIDQVTPSLTPKKEEYAETIEKKPAATTEHSQQNSLPTPNLPCVKEETSTPCGLDCEKETLPLLSPLKAEARILSAKLEKGITGFFTTMMPLVKADIAPLLPAQQPEQEHLPPSQTATKLAPPKTFSTTTTLKLKEEKPVKLSHKKPTQPKKNLPLPNLTTAFSHSISLVCDEYSQEKELSKAKAALQKIRTETLPTKITTPLSPTSSALLGLSKDKKHPAGKVSLTPLAEKKSLHFVACNHFEKLDLPEKVKEILPTSLQPKKASVTTPTAISSLAVNVTTTVTPNFYLQENITVQKANRDLPHIKIPLPELNLTLMQALPETEMAEPITLSMMQPKRENGEIRIAIVGKNPNVIDITSQHFSLATNDTLALLTNFNEPARRHLEKSISPIADDILAMQIELAKEEKDPLSLATSNAEQEATWTTSINMALSQTSVPLLTSKPLIDKERLRAGTLLFAEDKIRDRTSHERHLVANRLYRNTSTFKVEGTSDAMIKVDAPFDPYVEYATDGQGGYFFGIELHLLKGLELPTQKQNFLFMIDRSKATDRTQYESYKQGVLKSLSYLKKDDIFNIYIFDSRNKQLAPISLPATKQNIAKARNFLTDEKHGILFRSAKIYNLIEEMVGKVQDENLLTNIVFMAGPKTLSDLRTKRLDVASLLETNKNHANLFFITSCDKENFSMMKLLATFNRGQAIYSPTNTSIPRKIANLVHRISRPIAKEMHVLTRTENAKIELFSSKLNRTHLYKNNAFKVYGHINQLEDFDIILQGQGEENWLHMNQRIKLKNGLRVGRSLRKTLAGLQVLPLYKRYIDEGIPDHLWEATKITTHYNLEQPYTWD